MLAAKCHRPVGRGGNLENLRSSITTGYAHNRYLRDSEDLFRKMPVNNAGSWSTMIHARALVGDVIGAEGAFGGGMDSRVLISWTAMLTGYAKKRDLPDTRRDLLERQRNFFAA